MEIPVQSSQPRCSPLAVLGHDGFLAEGALGRLFPRQKKRKWRSAWGEERGKSKKFVSRYQQISLVVVVNAVDLVLVVRDEGHVDHVFLADDAQETVGVEAGVRSPDNDSKNVVVN